MRDSETVLTAPLRARISSRHLGKLERALIAALSPPVKGVGPAFLIWISGKSGAGKTTLLDAAHEQLSMQGQAWRRLRTEVFPRTSEILEPILAATRELIEWVRARADSGQAGWSEVWRSIRVRHAPALDRVLPEVDWGESIIPYPSLEPAYERERLLDHLSGVFLRCAEQEGIVLEVEGADHLDALSREFLLKLARVVRARQEALHAGLPLPAPPRLALVLTTGEREDAPLAIPSEEIVPIVLGGIGREELGKILGDEYGEEVPLSIREKLFQLTHGNPFELEVRIGRERALRETGTVFTLKRLIEVGSMEQELHRAFSALAPLERRLLCVLALLEKPVLTTIPGRLLTAGPAELDSAVEHLVVCGWLVRRRSEVIGLRHEKLRSFLADGVGTDDRLEMHRRLAESIASEYEGRPCRRLQEVYHHYRNACVDEKVVQAGMAAAREATRLYDFEGALRIYEELLAIPQEMAAGDYLQLAIEYAELLEQHGAPDDTRLCFFEQILEDEAQRFPIEARAGLWRRLARLAARTERPEKELAALEIALRLLQGTGQCTERMLVHAAVARAFLRRRQFDASLRYCREGITLHEINTLRADPEFLELYRVSEEAHLQRGELVEALSFEEQHLELARRHGNVQQVLDSLLRLTQLKERRGLVDEAHEELVRALPIAQSTGSRALQADLDEKLGFHYMQVEDWSRAREAFQRALQVHTEAGDESRIVRLLGALGLAALLLGDADRGAASFRLYALQQGTRTKSNPQSLQVPGFPCDYSTRAERDEQIRKLEESLAQARGDRQPFLVESLSELGDLRRDCGEFEAARTALRRGLRAAAGKGAEAARLCLQLAIIYRMQGAFDAALDSLQKGLNAAHELSDQRDWVAEFHVQVGLLAVAQGNFTRALDYLARGLRTYLEVEHDLGVAHTLLHLADLFRRLGEYPAAEELGMAALALGHAKGLARLEGEAWLLLGVVRTTSGCQPSGKQEIEVAREIMGRLGLLEGRCRALLAEASVHLRWGDAARAYSLSGEALEVARDLGLRGLLAQGLILRGLCEGARRGEQGDFLRAVQTLESAVEHCRELGDRDLELSAHLGIARLYEQRGREGVVGSEMELVQKLLEGLLATCPDKYQRPLIAARRASIPIPGEAAVRRDTLAV